jgi:phenylpropionate dioxygenase-like ring-hydroxylating dioxygenase large terminal subunit
MLSYKFVSFSIAECHPNCLSTEIVLSTTTALGASQNTPEKPLLDTPQMVRRILDHIDNKTTDLGTETWNEPVANYRSQARLDAELDLIRNSFVVFCPSLALAKTGDYVARSAAGVPLIAVRAEDGTAKVFRNACRHRGVQVAEGHGCKRVLVCPYHGWAYALDGQLKNIPHVGGFPEVDTKTSGLVPVPSKEIDGLVYVGQEATGAATSPLDAIPKIIPDNYELVEIDEMDVDANWKLYIESALEGYHIRSTHTQTFFPVQYDNLTVVEGFGPNSRVTFPYQTIEKLRTKPQEEWSTDGRVTQLYHLFPNVLVSTFPNCLQVVVLEPLGLERTRQHTYLLGRVAEGTDAQRKAMTASIMQGQAFAKTGAIEDREVVMSAQQGLNSGANDHLTFGLFESAIGRLHAGLKRALG